MDDRRSALRKLSVGEIFHAESPNGASLICLVTAVGDTIIQARTVTTQVLLNFDRQTGVESWGNDASKSRIDSVEPLPPEIFDVILGLDRKFGEERPIEEYKLTSAEKKGLIFVDRFYKDNIL